MAYYANQTISDFIYAPSGRTFPTNASLNPMLSAFTPVIVANGVDRYLVTFTPIIVGTWLVDVTDNLGVRYTNTYDVDEVSGAISDSGAGAPSVVTTSTITALASTTVQEVRRNIHAQLDDLVILTLTADGGTGAAIDNQNIFDSTDAFRGSHLYVVSSTNPSNIGRVAVVDGSSATQGSLSFSPPLTAPTATGDVLDLTNKHGDGWSRAEVVQRINLSLAELFPSVLIPRIDELATAYDRGTGYVLIPDGVTHLYGVQFYRHNQWVDVPAKHWEAKPGEGRIYLYASTTWDANAKNVRMRGFGIHPAVAGDADPIYADPTYLRLDVSSFLAAQRGRRREESQWAVEWRRGADQRRNQIMTALPPNTVRVR